MKPLAKTEVKAWSRWFCHMDTTQFFAFKMRTHCRFPLINGGRAANRGSYGRVRPALRVINGGVQ